MAYTTKYTTKQHKLQLFPEKKQDSVINERKILQAKKRVFGFIDLLALLGHF